MPLAGSYHKGKTGAYLTGMNQERMEVLINELIINKWQYDGKTFFLRLGSIYCPELKNVFHLYIFSWAQKRISRYPCPGGRVISIFVFPSYLLLFYYNYLLLSPGVLLNWPYILIALLFIQSIICLLAFYSHINAISSLFSLNLIVQNRAGEPELDVFGSLEPEPEPLGKKVRSRSH